MVKKQNKKTKKGRGKKPDQKNQNKVSKKLPAAEEEKRKAVPIIGARPDEPETDEEKEISPGTIKGILEEEESFEESMDIADDDAEEEGGDWE